jgi:hypothetical protein
MPVGSLSYIQVRGMELENCLGSRSLHVCRDVTGSKKEDDGLGDRLWTSASPRGKIDGKACLGKRRLFLTIPGK